MVLYWRRYGRVGGCQNPGGLAQLGERLPCKQEVTSSNLVISTKTFWKRRRWSEWRTSLLVEAGREHRMHLQNVRERKSRRLLSVAEAWKKVWKKERLDSGSYAATKFERTSLSGQVTTFTRDVSAMQTYQVFTVMYLENYILKMIKTSNRKLIYKHIF